VTRGAAFAVLSAAGAVVAATFVFTLLAIGAGTWQPRGNPPPTETPAPIFDGDTGGGPAVEPEQQTLSYPDFLAAVKRGEIYDVTQDGRTLHASGQFTQYEVAIPGTSAHVLDDIEAAARAGGVDPPSFTKLPGS